MIMNEEITTEIERLKEQEPHLKQFGKTMTIVLGILCILTLFTGSGWFPLLLMLCVGFGAITIIEPSLLRKPYIVWMSLAIILGFFVTKVLLSLMFYTVFTIFGVIARLFNNDMLDQQYEPQASTYWRKKEQPEDIKQHLERQF